MISTIAVEKIEANPFRLYNVLTVEEKEIVSFLKESINKSGIWTNIIIRPHPTKSGSYQEAFGKKRLTAIKELNIQNIEVIVKKLTDLEMLQHLAFENTTNKKTIGFIIELIQGSKKILNPYLNSTYENIPNELKYCFTKESFKSCQKQKTISGNVIHEFLKISISKRDLQTINQILEEESNLKIEDILNFKSARRVRSFSQAIKRNKIEIEKISSLSKICIQKDLNENQIFHYIDQQNTYLKKIHNPILELMNLANDINNNMKYLKTKVLKYFKLLEKENTSLGTRQEFIHTYHYQQLKKQIEEVYELLEKMLQPKGDIKKCQNVKRIECEPRKVISI